MIEITKATELCNVTAVLTGLPGDKAVTMTGRLIVAVSLTENEEEGCVESNEVSYGMGNINLMVSGIKALNLASRHLLDQVAEVFGKDVATQIAGDLALEALHGIIK